MRRVAFALVFALPALAVAASSMSVSSERALREECSAFAQAAMRECLARKAQDSETALRQAEEQATSALGRWDEDSQYVKQARSALAASNREFAKYRDAQCGFAASLSGGAAGNAHEMGRLACFAELNSRRAEQLRDALSELPLK